MLNAKPIINYSLLQRCFGWLIHAFTASGACIGLLALLAIYHHESLFAFWLMGTAIFIDAIDGTLARIVNIKQVVSRIDGTLLDNIVDFVNYTIVPAFFLLINELLPAAWRTVCAMGIVFCSAYQFTQIDAKTNDHFFKGFPSYWNIVVFYLFFWHMRPILNVLILIGLAFLSFIPIKYIYPSRLDYLSNRKSIRISMMLMTFIWSIATVCLLWIYPRSNYFLTCLSMSYLILYLGMSLYRTWIPLPPTHLNRF